MMTQSGMRTAFVLVWAPLLALGLLAQPRPVPAQVAGATQRVQLGETVILSDDLEYDLAARQYILTGHCEVLTRDSRLTADKMTVQMNAANEAEKSVSEGKVSLERRDLEAGTKMTGKGNYLEYYHIDQKGFLRGSEAEGVVMTQESPRLARPAVITGLRVDFDQKTKVNVVQRSASAQARAHVEPKGTEGKTPPEPADLIADKITQNAGTQEYVAVGSPKMVRPSSTLSAKTIRFTVEQKNNEINTALAEEKVVYDGKSDNGSVVHATGNKGTFDRETNLLTMEGDAYATVLDPGQEKPQVYQGTTFLYNNKTGYRRLKQGTVSVPTPPKKPAGEMPPPEKKPAEKPAGVGSGG